MRSYLSIFLSLVVIPIQAQNTRLYAPKTQFHEAYAILVYQEDPEMWGLALLANSQGAKDLTYTFKPGQILVTLAEASKAHAIKYMSRIDGSFFEAGSQIEDPPSSIDTTHGQYASLYKGRLEAFTGSQLNSLKGYAGSLTKDDYIIIGNTLENPEILQKMAQAYEDASGSLAQRLLASIQAGTFYGKTIQSAQSAVLRILKPEHSLGEIIDLRVDYAPQAVKQLEMLLDQHIARDLLDEVIIELKRNSRADVKLKLEQVKLRTQGYFDIYPRLVMTYMLAKQDKMAWQLIQDALKNEPSWERYLPAYYPLIANSAYAQAIESSAFTLIDWHQAIETYLELDRVDEAISLINQTLKKYADKAYSYYLMGQAYLQKKNKKLARKSFQRALKLDSSLQEAKIALDTLTK